MEPHPLVRFGGERTPDVATLEQMHLAAHRECFIANSVLTEVKVESPASA